jgi:hypothetical protein
VYEKNLITKFEHHIMSIDGKPEITLKVSAMILAIILLALSTNTFADSNSTAQSSKQALVTELRKGGYNIYFRHEATDWNQSDNVTRVDDWLSCDSAEMRQLSAEGRESAASTGRAIKALEIPTGLIKASPYCRTMETARLMQLGKVEATPEVMNLRVAEYFGGRGAIISSARALLAKKPAAGTNNIIVAHGNVARNATPVYPGEGEAVIFKPDSQGGFTLLGRLTAEDWVSLAGAAAQ